MNESRISEFQKVASSKAHFLSKKQNGISYVTNYRYSRTYDTYDTYNTYNDVLMKNTKFKIIFTPPRSQHVIVKTQLDPIFRRRCLLRTDRQDTDGYK